MRNPIRMAAMGMLAAALLGAQDWQNATALPAVDLGGLTPAQTTRVLKLLRANDCSCGCGMKLAECRMKDPNCTFSRGLASVIVSAIKDGKTDQAAMTEAANSRFAHGPQHSDRVLDDPVKIPVAGAPVTGPLHAAITLVEFSDFQCPYCVKAVAQLRAVLAAYPTQVKLIFKQFPLDSHSQAAVAAAASMAAHRQGKFWPLHDALFAQQGKLSPEKIVSLAAGVGLDMQRFAADMKSPEIGNIVTKDLDDGQVAGVDSTPTLFINGQHYNGIISLEALKPVLDAELKKLAGKTIAAR